MRNGSAHDRSGMDSDAGDGGGVGSEVLEVTTEAMYLKRRLDISEATKKATFVGQVKREDRSASAGNIEGAMAGMEVEQ